MKILSNCPGACPQHSRPQLLISKSGRQNRIARVFGPWLEEFLSFKTSEGGLIILLFDVVFENENEIAENVVGLRVKKNSFFQNKVCAICWYHLVSKSGFKIGI